MSLERHNLNGSTRKVLTSSRFPSARASASGRYVFSVGFGESGFQTVVARASRPCLGGTNRTDGTPVPLREAPARCSLSPRERVRVRGIELSSEPGFWGFEIGRASCRERV